MNRPLDWHRYLGRVVAAATAVLLIGVVSATASDSSNRDGITPGPTLSPTIAQTSFTSDPDQQLVTWSIRERSLLEMAVLVFQVGGLATLAIWRLAPQRQWAHCGRLSFVGALAGLGLSGTICAWQRLELALFAGGTMAILVCLAFLASGHADAGRTESQARGSSA